MPRLFCDLCETEQDRALRVDWWSICEACWTKATDDSPVIRLAATEADRHVARTAAKETFQRMFEMQELDPESTLEKWLDEQDEDGEDDEDDDEDEPWHRLAQWEPDSR